jgi:hypothetical protein
VLLSLAAQLAVAEPSASGWLLSAVPALAFLALTKLVLSTKPTDPQPATAATAVVDDQGVTDPARPAALVPVPVSAFTRVNRASAVPR